MGAASVLVLAWRAGSSVCPWAVTRKIISDPLRIGPVDGGDAARCAYLLRGLTAVATVVVVVVVATMASAMATMGRSRASGDVESRSMRGTDARGGGAEEWHVSRR